MSRFLFMLCAGSVLPLMLSGQSGFTNKAEVLKRIRELAIVNPQTLAVPSGSLSKPDRQYDYLWDSNANSWAAKDTLYYTYNHSGQYLTYKYISPSSSYSYSYLYNPKGDPIEISNSIFDFTNQSWTPNRKTFFQYDSRGKQIAYERQAYQVASNTWVLEQKTRDLFTYNSAGRITEHTFQIWDLSQSQWVNQSKQLNHQYNSSGQLLSYENQTYSMSSASWENDFKEILFYDIQGHPYEFTQLKWVGSAYVNSVRLLNMTWRTYTNTFDGTNPFLYSVTGELSSATFQYANTWNPPSPWYNDYKVSTNYDALGGFVRISQTFTNNAWVNEERHTSVNDSKLNPISFKIESWNANQNNWVIDHEWKYLITYGSGNNILEHITQIYLPNFGPGFENSSKVIYENYRVYSSLSENQDKLYAGIRAYPNPCRDFSSILLPEELENKTGDLQITLYDVFSRECLRQDLRLNKRIDLRNLSSGVYSYLIYYNGEVLKNGKLLIE